MPTIFAFDGIENKHDACRGVDCMKKFFKSLREHAMKIINFQKKKLIPLKTNSKNLMKRQKSKAFANKSLNINTLMIKIIAK